MNEERRYGINWVDLIIKIILLILFVLLICWLFPMPKLDTFYDKVFNENIQTMKTAARDYYTKDRLPSAIGETKSMTLKQLIDSKLILEFSDKDGNACDTSNSYVQVTKTLDSEYALKVQLSCGDETDYIIDTIGCNGTCLLSDVNSTAKTSNNDGEDGKTSTIDKGYSTGAISNRYYYPLSRNNATSTNTNSNGGSTHTTKTTTITTTVTQKPNSNNNATTTPSDNNGSKTLYYQQARIVNDYGNWIEGYRSGNNIETKTDTVNYYYYTRNNNSGTTTYRTTSYVFANDFAYGKTYTYELQLTDVPSNANNIRVINNRYFNSNDYQLYLNSRNKNLYMSGNDMLSNSNNRNANSFRNSSLKNGNFRYSISNAYKSNGVWRVKVTITLVNHNGVSAYYDSSLNNYLYYVPVYFQTNYSSSGNTIVDTAANSYKYNGYNRSFAYSKTINYYRYVNRYVDYNQTKWSTNRNLSGYQFTGATKYA